MIATYLAAAAVFLLAVAGMAVGVIVGRRALQCSCKITPRIMGEAEPDPCPHASSCARRMVDDIRRIQTPGLLADTDPPPGR